jgi:sugar lactone lactonase YvrE
MKINLCFLLSVLALYLPEAAVAQDTCATPRAAAAPVEPAGLFQPAGVAVSRAGTIYVADTGHHAICQVTPAGGLTILAGLPGSFGSADGIGSAARFNSPQSMAADAAGNLYVADTYNNTIRRVTPAGAVTTLAGLAGSPGSQDGTGGAARFSNPRGVALDAAGNVYVADRRNHTIRVVTPAGMVTTLAGLAGNAGSQDGTGSAARFNSPQGVAVDGSGKIYVADRGNNSIRVVTSTGVVTTLAGLAGSVGSDDGTGSDARFRLPASVAVDSAGRVSVAEPCSGTIREVTPAGVVTTLAGWAGRSGCEDGAGGMATFNLPSALAVDAAGNLYVADTFNNSIRRVSPGGVVSTLTGRLARH